MKVLEFETSKGRFKLIDMPETIRLNGWSGSIVIDELNQIPQEKYAKGFYLKNISEEQASEIIGFQYMDYISKPTSIESLHSLLKSKGIYLFKNPHPIRYIMAMTDKGIIDTTEKLYLEAEEKTFYNPYIFKL